MPKKTFDFTGLDSPEKQERLAQAKARQAELGVEPGYTQSQPPLRELIEGRMASEGISWEEAAAQLEAELSDT